MDKVYNHKEVEEKIYKEWEERGYFKPEVNPNGKPYTIILPPPNANGALHFGHAMFVIEDILIRYHRMKGFAALWLPGTDHAGIETQFVFEKRLAAEGKSRLDFDRETLYKMIWDYVEENKGGIQNQLRKLGFSLDWSREKYTLDPDIVNIVHKTFKKMYEEGLIYRGERLVNYCTRCGTSFSDIEIKYVEQKDPLYYIKYGPFILATVRPETKFGDTAVAVNPKDKRYKEYVGKEIEVEGLLGKFKIKVVEDEVIDPSFGTGVAKVTPAHDFNDFEMGKRHNLEMKQVIGFDGKLTEIAGHYAGMYVKPARRKIAEDMQEKGLIEKIDENYVHTVATCYKCKTTLEPLPLPQWYIKVKSLAEKAILVVKNKEVSINPERFEKIYYQWMENLRDWNISRQVVWGIRIPAWKCLNCHPGEATTSIGSQNSKDSIAALQNDNAAIWVVTEGDKPEKCPNCGSINLEQDIDTFDTWFSSSQWPFATLMSSSSSKFKIQSSKSKQGEISDFDKFYPTSVMETGYDILKPWVSRMIMMGLLVTGKIPFENVVLHGLVLDPLGKKMSKSKGNVVNPLEVIDTYGADALRFALIYGTAMGNDQALSFPKFESARRFTNKLWNMGRFIEMKKVESGELKVESYETEELLKMAKNEGDKEIIKKTQKLIKEITNYLDNYQFNYAAEMLYEFTWHEFADKYIEKVKSQKSKVKTPDQNSFIILNSLFIILLKLLHPFMPFVTEELYKKMSGNNKFLIIDKWPA